MSRSEAREALHTLRGLGLEIQEATLTMDGRLMLCAVEEDGQELEDIEIEEEGELNE